MTPPPRTDETSHDEARPDASPHLAEMAPPSPSGDSEVPVPLHEQARPDTTPSEEQSSETVPVQDTSANDLTRGDAERRDTYTLSVEQIMQRLDVEGVSKSKRTVQKYLNRGEIDGQLVTMANGKKWLANELDLARFIEELKRKEALALLSKPDRSVFPAPAVEEATSTEPVHRSSETSVLEERVYQLQSRLVSSEDENSFLRGQVQAANDHVKLWSDRASELKDLLQAQTENNQPVLAAFATSLESQTRRSKRPDTNQRGLPLTDAQPL